MAFTKPATDREPMLAAVAYILTWITGIIIFLVADKKEKYARAHALQAIGVGAAIWIVSIIIGLLKISILSSLVWIASILAIIFLAYKAFKVESVEIPVISDFAEKNA